MSHTGEIVTLAVRPINVSVGRQMADALPTVAIASSTTRGVARGLFAGVCAQHVLPALAAGSHVARVAGAYPTLEGAAAVVALGAVRFRFLLTVTAALWTDKYFHGIPQPHRLYDNTPASLTVWYTHSHVE